MSSAKKKMFFTQIAAVNVRVAHSNKWNFLQHSKETAGRMKSLEGPDLGFETPGLSITGQVIDIGNPLFTI